MSLAKTAAAYSPPVKQGIFQRITGKAPPSSSLSAAKAKPQSMQSIRSAAATTRANVASTRSSVAQEAAGKAKGPMAQARGTAAAKQSDKAAKNLQTKATAASATHVKSVAAKAKDSVSVPKALPKERLTAVVSKAKGLVKNNKGKLGLAAAAAGVGALALAKKKKQQATAPATA